MDSCSSIFLCLSGKGATFWFNEPPADHVHSLAQELMSCSMFTLLAPEFRINSARFSAISCISSLPHAERRPGATRYQRGPRAFVFQLQQDFLGFFALILRFDGLKAFSKHGTRCFSRTFFSKSNASSRISSKGSLRASKSPARKSSG